MPSKKDLLRKLLKGIETGDAMAAAVVDEERYIQHNPQTHEGGEGLAALFARLSKTKPKVKFVRVFEDGDFAFAHNEYDFGGVRVAFEVFRFENKRAVEHWDNIQPIAGPNASGRGMTDGTTAISDLDKTEANRALAREFVETALIGRSFENLGDYVHEALIQHAPDIADGIPALSASMDKYRYDRLHRVLAEGNFALCVCEGVKNSVHSGLYNLFRVEDGQIAENWTTVEATPPRDQWKNDNGKF
ncbi:MAG: hypothetical protein AAGD43_21925 [Pseudomonadota bacterium]